MEAKKQSGMEHSYNKSLNQPDERREFKAHGHLDVTNFPDGTSIGRGTFEPGWKWSNDVKPIAGTHSCEAAHSGYVISGSMVVHMNSGEEFTIRAGDSFRIPPGHDAWVVGNGPCVLVDVTGFSNYAKRAKPKVA
jgi:mannose-6-phosphate isomerase-like protein (cupin superfamily)